MMSKPPSLTDFTTPQEVSLRGPLWPVVKRWADAGLVVYLGSLNPVWVQVFLTTKGRQEVATLAKTATVTTYVCGFLFTLSDRDTPRVLLIRKERPAWQRGLLNGVGGKVEAGETPLEAMVREFGEEAGVTVTAWEPVAVLTGSDWVVHFFSAWASTELFNAAGTVTDEDVYKFNVGDLPPRPLVPNLRFLLPLALDTSGIVKPVALSDRSTGLTGTET